MMSMSWVAPRPFNRAKAIGSETASVPIHVWYFIRLFKSNFCLRLMIPRRRVGVIRDGGVGSGTSPEPRVRAAATVREGSSSGRKMSLSRGPLRTRRGAEWTLAHTDFNKRFHRHVKNSSLRRYEPEGGSRNNLFISRPFAVARYWRS